MYNETYVKNTKRRGTMLDISYYEKTDEIIAQYTCEEKSLIPIIQGIQEEYRSFIFQPGFSTKINYTTGEVKRGLGLSLVCDLVEQELAGHVWLDETAKETTFVLEIPKEILEG